VGNKNEAKPKEKAMQITVDEVFSRKKLKKPALVTSIQGNDIFCPQQSF
jgi:hypothetical protein